MRCCQQIDKTLTDTASTKNETASNFVHINIGHTHSKEQYNKNCNTKSVCESLYRSSLRVHCSSVTL